MKKILAVSGGIDSMVLMHYFKDDPDAIVAHFNHGTRPSANSDQKFVKKWAREYGLQFVTEKQILGENVSEEKARQARYDFLLTVAIKYGGVVFTAHHADDVVESIAINLARGTGWRGLVPFSNPGIMHPFLSMSKKGIYKYAAEHQVVYRQDPTNTEEHYLRNRIRAKLLEVPHENKEKLMELSASQDKLKSEIDETLNYLIPEEHIYQRSWFKQLDDEVAIEILRMGLASIGRSATRPQLADFLKAIRTYAPEKSFNLPDDYLVKMHKTYFML